MLRGTRKRQRSTFEKPTLQNQLDTLRRQVNKNKPETQYFRIKGNWTSTGTSTQQFSHNVTESLLSSSDFRDNVTGDVWSNLRLDYRTQLTPDSTQYRVIIYTPKKAGQRFTPPNYHFVTIPDPTAFTVWYDHSFSRDFDYVHQSGTKRPHQFINKKLNLRGMLTKNNSETSTIEKGELIITIIYDPQTNAELQGDYAYMLTYANK